MHVTLYNQAGEKAGTHELSDRLFSVAFDPDVVHSALLAHRANARVPLAHTKGRGDVRGGGKKPWRQKGTGRARHGSTRSPIWVGGGVAFGPKKERNFSQKINKKQKQKALAMMLSAKAKNKELAVVDALSFEEPKTKTMAGVVSAFLSSVFGAPLYRKVLVAVPANEKNVFLSGRNLPRVKVISADSLNVYDLLAHPYLVLSKDAIEVVERTYTKVK